MEIVGYADRLSARPGETVRFMVSAKSPRYRARVVRLLHGDANPAGPGFKALPVASAIEGEYEGVEQALRPGSYIRVPRALPLAASSAATVHLWFQATLPELPRQVLLSTGVGGLTVALVDGRATLEVAGKAVVQLGALVRPHVWYRLVASCDPVAGRAALRLDPLPTTAATLADANDAPLDRSAPRAPSGTTLIAAEPLEAENDAGTTSHFNGKIEAPAVFDRVLDAAALDALHRGMAPTELEGLVAGWDFSRNITTQTIRDVSGHGLDGLTVQRPTRAVTGHNWDGSEFAWRHAPHQYGAIHFHDDDLDDAGWDASLAWAIPETLASGVYALQLESANAEDFIPFYIRPRAGAAHARILFLAPVFSYLAYANEQLLGTPESREAMRQMNDGVLGRLGTEYPTQPQDRFIMDHRLRSLYDAHSDGSGVCYSSRLRPIVNMRPKYDTPALNLGSGTPHQFNADLHLVDWLYEKGYEIDVATDEDLHHEGTALLERYQVVLTGTHHEYWSGAMLDATEAYLNRGGRLMYLAGNGFYWVTELDPEAGHTIEIRRAGPSTRTWDAQPGEGHLSFTGRPGGLWRHAGRAPQRLVGVGFTAQGLAPGRPFEEVAGARKGRGAFVFDGLEPGALIGDGPSLVNEYGGAGFEIDRVDAALGSPYDTLVLATATGFSDAYQHVSEETLVSNSRQGGTVNPLVKADMTLLPYPGGGAVFSASSIAWCGSLSHNGYDNAVSRVTQNVLDRFLRDEPI